MKNINILIKPSSEKCNMDCDYCFYHDISSKRITKDFGYMSVDTAKKVIDRVFEIDTLETATIGFQGGEPTLIGLDFFKEFVKYVEEKNKEKNIKFTFMLQTNGMFLSESFMKFFKEKNFLIGVSLDGNPQIHNLYRKDIGGHDTYERIKNVIKKMEEHEVSFNILTVITKEHTKNVEKLYKFYKKNNYEYLQFIPCLHPFNEQDASKPWLLDNPSYFRFLDELFNLWINDIKKGENAPNIRYFSNLISMLRGNPPESCDMRGICTIQNIIEADGSMYPCDFYVFENEKLGNVHENSLREMIYSQKSKDFIGQSIVKNTKCAKCKYFSLCRNGCKRSRDNETNLNLWCEATYKFLDKNYNDLVAVSRL